MKEKYLSPEVEIIAFDTEDVITASLIDGGIAGDYSGNGDIYIPG